MKSYIFLLGGMLLLFSPSSQTEQATKRQCASSLSIPSAHGGLVGTQPACAQAFISTRHEYWTRFSHDENPISEGGAWVNGKAVGLDWADVRTASNLAMGASLPSKYADPTAVLVGAWRSNQRVEGRVRVKAAFSHCCREVELRLRTAIEPHRITGYEVLCSIVGDFPYIAIVRWNGALNDFTELAKIGRNCEDGDLLAAVAFGDTITVYKNGEKVLESTDNQFMEGNPGLGFYDYGDDIWARLGFTFWSEFGFGQFFAADHIEHN
jgi:hypothetical protein